ncbi:MAG: alkaline phosphatase family protein, partial [Rhodobacteraceae bacterium]|nr:alkaline phosphatase family protein [Paracoccaceae bacterium]
FPEPDTSFHYLEIGSDATRAAMAAADAAFARLLEAVPPGTAVVALSDHGQIATSGQWGIEAEMRAAGLQAARAPLEGDAIALTLGRMGECRLLRPDAALLADTAAWLMGRPEIGMLFARDDLAAALPGALPLSAVLLDHPRAADLIYVMTDEPAPDQHGLPGRGLMTGGGVPIGGGMHGGLAPGELSTVFFLRLPDQTQGQVDDRPCALPDVAPTLLAVLGPPPLAGADGRALPLDGTAPTTPEAEHRLTAHGPGGFAQELVLRSGDGRVVIEHGRRL